jgi:hypothetical protein
LDEHTIIIVEGIVIISNNRPTLLGIRHKALRENLKMYWEGGRGGGGTLSFSKE